MKRTGTSSSLQPSNSRSSNNLNKNRQQSISSSSSFRQPQQRGTTTTDERLEAEEEIPIPSLGPGWLPVSGAQQFRTLRKGPLYDPRTLPVIPAPFLVDTPPAGDASGADVPAFPEYRVADALPATHMDDDDEPYSAPLPDVAGFGLHTILEQYASPTSADSAHDLSGLQSQASLADALGEDDKDNLITHAAVVAMVRLGRPKDVSEASFMATVRDVRDVLLRQRALFPQRTASEATSGSKKLKSASSKATPNDGDDNEGGGVITVNNPRVAVVTYDDVLANAAFDIAARSGDASAAATAAAARAASQAAPSMIPGGSGDDPPIAHWSFHDTYVATVQKVIKKTEALRKKQQLYIGYGRSVTFDRADELPLTSSDAHAIESDRGYNAAGFGGRAPPSYRVDVEKKSNSMAALTLSPTTSLMTSQTEKESAPSNHEESEEPASPSVLGVDATDPSPLDGLQQGSREGSPLAVETSIAVPSLLGVASSGAMSQSPTGPFDDAAAERRDVNAQHVVVAVKSCGDPKSMRALDKCDWVQEDLTDAFHLVLDAASKPTTLLSTDPNGWIERARAEARNGRYLAAPRVIQEVASFKTAAPPLQNNTSTAKSAGSTPALQRLASQHHSGREATAAAPQPAQLVSTASHSFAPPVATTVASAPDTAKVSSVVDTISAPLTAPELASSTKEADALATSSKSSRSVLSTGPLATSSSNAPSSKPPAGKRQGSATTGAATTSSKTTPKTESKKRILSSEATPISDEGLAAAPNPAAALLSLFAAVDDGKLPHGLPPLTVVFDAFTVVSTLLPTNTDDLENDSGERAFVSFQQLRPFYLRPPRREEDEEEDDDGGSDDDSDDEFWDEAVEDLQQDMNDELLVPMTPPSTPVSWTPPEPESPFVPAPFTQLLIDRLEAGIPTPKNSSDDESEGDHEEDAGGATGTSTAVAEGKPPKRRASEDHDEVVAVKHSNDAVKMMEQANNEVLRGIEVAREEKLQTLRAMRGGAPTTDRLPRDGGDGSGLEGTAWERTLERFLCPSRKYTAPRGAPLLLNTRLPMRMEGTTSVVRRLMRRSKKDILALSKKSKQMQLVSFRPSRRFLAEVLRLRSFGSLVVALLSNPDTPIPEEAVSVSMEALGDTLLSVWESTPADRQRRLLMSTTQPRRAAGEEWWDSIRHGLRALHVAAKRDDKMKTLHQSTPNGVPWRDVVGVLGGRPAAGQAEGSSVSSQRKSSQLIRSANPSASHRRTDDTVDEGVLRRGTSHFLPTLSSSSPAASATNATRLAQLRRAPRAMHERSSLEPSYMDRPLEPQRFLRSAGGQDTGKKLFSAFRSGTPLAGSKPLQVQGAKGGGEGHMPPPPTPHPHQVYASHLYPLPVEVVGGGVEHSPTLAEPQLGVVRGLSSRQQQALSLQQGGLRQLNELRFGELHDTSTLK